MASINVWESHNLEPGAIYYEIITIVLNSTKGDYSRWPWNDSGVQKYLSLASRLPSTNGYTIPIIL